MELYQIRYFLAVSRTLNFTRAAAECNVTQPALTRAIRKLEDELGGDLIRRERTRSHLTQLGQAMLPMLQASYDAAAAAKAEAETFGRGDVAPLRIGLSESVPAILLRPVLQEVKRAVPGLVLTLARADAAEVIRALESAEVDFAVSAAEAARMDHLRHWPLFEEDFVLCGGGLADGGAGLPALEPDALISRPYCETDAHVREVWARAGHGDRTVYTLSGDRDLALLTDLHGVAALVPRSCAAAEGLPFREIGAEAPRRQVSLHAAAGRQHNPAASAFLRLMRSTELVAPVACRSAEAV